VAALSRWPTCLRLPAGEVDLLLPASLIEQVLPCEPVEMPSRDSAGWHREADVAGSALSRVRFVPARGEEGREPPWTATWVAILRRLGEGSVAHPRFGLLLSAAPQLLEPLTDSVEILDSGPGSAEAASVAVAGARLVVPDLAALPQAAAVPAAAGGRQLSR
jgi:hypothetical protein